MTADTTRAASLCPCGGKCHHDTSPCSLGCWAAQKPWRPEEEYERGKADRAALRADQPREDYDAAKIEGRRIVEQASAALTALGFGWEAIVTGETPAGEETVVHVTTPNPDMAWEDSDAD